MHGYHLTGGIEDGAARRSPDRESVESDLVGCHLTEDSARHGRTNGLRSVQCGDESCRKSNQRRRLSLSGFRARPINAGNVWPAVVSDFQHGEIRPARLRHVDDVGADHAALIGHGYEHRIRPRAILQYDVPVGEEVSRRRNHKARGVEDLSANE